MIHKTAYEMNQSYAHNIHDAIEKYLNAGSVKNAAEFVRKFNELIPEAPVSESTFRNWQHGNSIPSLYYLVRLAEFMEIDLYELIYNLREEDK